MPGTSPGMTSDGKARDYVTAARFSVRSMSKNKGLRGTVSLRPLRKLGSLSAPRLCGDILTPMPPCLTSVSARDSNIAVGVDLGIAAQATAG